MKFEFNSNTIMAIVMVVGMGGGLYSHIENQIKNVDMKVDTEISKLEASVKGQVKDLNEKVNSLEIPSAYDDSTLVARVTELEKVNIQGELKLLTQKIDGIKPYDPTQIERDVNDIKVIIGQIQTKLEAVEKHTHATE